MSVITDFRERKLYEILNGIKVFMASPAIKHHDACRRIIRKLDNHFANKKCRVFNAPVDVFLTDHDTAVPDICVVCDLEKIGEKGIHGSPDLIVEVLSPSTKNYDRGYKKDLYERVGVTEYWIADPRTKSIEVYLIENGRYVLTGAYEAFTDAEVADMKDEDREKTFFEFKTHLSDELIIDIRDIFPAED